MPFRQNPHFLGREEQLVQLRTALAEGKPGVLVQALHGLGGVGKTRLAVEYAYAAAHAGVYDVVWFLRADNLTTLLSDYAALGVKLGIVSAEQANQADASGIVRQWLGDNVRWLLIFDDASGPNALRGLLPMRTSGHAIVTSRSHDWWEHCVPIPVGVLARSAAADLLLARSGRTERGEAEALAEALGDLPLALQQAGAQVARRAISFGRYLEQYRARRFELLKYESGPDDHQANVAATYSLAVDGLIVDTDPTVRESVELLRLCAFLAPQPDTISLSLLRAGQIRATDNR